MGVEYIKREDAIKWLTNLREDCGRYQDMWHYAEALDQIIELLSEDAARGNHGRWIDTDRYGFPVMECSECGAQTGTLNFPYCFNCGARMDGDKDE